MSPPARVLVNPSSGHGIPRRVLDAVRAQAERHGAPLTVSADLADFVARARDAVRSGTERLVVVGGDGSLYHALQETAGTECALGVVPAGSGNDLARSLGVPADPGQALELALHAPLRRIDLARLGDRRFATVAGAGFHSEVARRAARVRIVRGPLIYPWSVVGTLARYRPPQFRVRWDDSSFEGPAWMAVLANTPYFGGGMRIAPGARPADGLLDLVIVRRLPALRLLAVFPRVYSGRHLDHPALLTARTARATLEVDRPSDWYGDGEPLLEHASGAVEIAVEPGALLVPLSESPA